MRIIYKQTLEVIDEQKLRLPETAILLDVQAQNGELCLWYLFDPDDPHTIEQTFYVIDTGNPFPDTLPAVYWKTVQLGAVVWHIWIKPVPRRRDPIKVELTPEQRANILSSMPQGKTN